MSRRLFGALAVTALATIAVFAYRAFTQEYRYLQLVQLGDELLAEDLPFQAARSYGSAIRIDPAEPIAYIKRADAEHRQGNVAPALSDLEAARSLSSDVALVSHRLADLYYELERFDEAALEYDRLLSLDPEAPVVLYQLGLVHFRAGREAEAIDALNRAATLRPDFWEALYLRGAVFRALGGTDEAESDFRRALAVNPDATLARSALIDLFLEASEPGPARELVQEEIDQNPGDAQSYLTLAKVHRIGGHVTDAIEAVALAMEQDPNLPEAYLMLGELWLDEASRLGDPGAVDKAVAALESVAKMDPSSGRAALALGRAYLAKGEEARGFEELERASQATPVSAEAHRLLGDLYRGRRNYTEAVTAYHVFLRLRGDNPAVLERLGDTYVDLEDKNLAAETYLKVAALEPTRAAPLVKAARAFLDAGDRAAAARVCRRGLSTNPENDALLALLSQAQSDTPSSDDEGADD